MTTFTEGRHTAEFLAHPANGKRSFEAAMITGGAILQAGTVLALAFGAATATADAGNAGDGAISAVTLGAGATPGTYVVTFIEPDTDAGDFTVESPTGETIGSGTVGSEFSGGGLTFTISDGAADFEAGDRFEIAVAEGDGAYAPYDPDATDGTASAVAILYEGVNATDADVPGTVVVRDAEVKLGSLIFDEDTEAGEKTAALAALEAQGIIAR